MVCMFCMDAQAVSEETLIPHSRENRIMSPGSVRDKVWIAKLITAQLRPASVELIFHREPDIALTSWQRAEARACRIAYCIGEILFIEQIVYRHAQQQFS